MPGLNARHAAAPRCSPLLSAAPLLSSRPAALDEARVEADVSDVVSVEQPGEEALQAQAVAAVGAGAVLPLQHTAAHTCQFHISSVDIE